jgi:hypothetical protein
LGGHDFIARTGPDIICEILVRAPHVPLLQERLFGLGYKFYRITDEGLLHCAEIRPTKQERDWLFTKQAPAELSAVGLSVRDKE